MVYTLIEFAKENQKDLAVHQVEREVEEKEEVEEVQKKVKQKKEHLTKKQKQRMQDRLVDGELPRGHDWVCLIRHLFRVRTKKQCFIVILNFFLGNFDFLKLI